MRLKAALARLLRPDKAKVILSLLLLGLIALGWGQGWVFADQELAASPPPWALPEPFAMLAWVAGVYLMVPVMAINLPLVLAFDLDLFRVPGVPLVLAMIVAYLWAVFFVTAFRILRRKGE